MQEQIQQAQPKKHWYDRYYKVILIIPLIFLALSIFYIFQFYHEHGDVFYTDVSITGGTTITVLSPQPIEEIESALKEQFPDVVVRGISDLRTGQQNGFFVESRAEVAELKPALEKHLGFTLNSENSSIEFTGSALSSSFYQQLRLALALAFIFMALVIFLIFRKTIPSLAVVFAALADIIMTVAVINLAGIELSLAGIVALLMLVGYSVDTDILLTTRVLRKGEGSVNSRIAGAFRTGIMMTLTAIAAVAASLFFTYAFSDILRQMFTILLIGLGFDIFNTWMTNASLIKWYAEVKHL